MWEDLDVFFQKAAVEATGRERLLESVGPAAAA
jgi:hypothetical protein